ncbi:hypothetical protein OG394_21280 [Kribbella sp. NBC_01245]|nr:hypothetical protein [Kribbella sp. NBC_01245]
MRVRLAQLLALTLFTLLACVACGSGSDDACAATPTPTMSEKEADKKC